MKGHMSVKERREAFEDELGVRLPTIGQFSLDEVLASTKHCENMIGAIQVPLGIAGKIRIKNQESRIKDYYIPLATTEGALVASVNRGCKAITQSGGASIISKKIGITRAPVFIVENIEAGQQFIEWIEKNTTTLKKSVESTSSHLTLLEIKPWVVGRNVFLRFRMDSQEAMGMNMATIAVDNAVRTIEEHTSVKCVALSGNMCVDKKPSFLNFLEGRGYSISADAIITAEVLSTALKTTASALFEVAQRKLVYGSVTSGSIGVNAHTANVLAAVFLATGQDIAHVAECSMGITTVERYKENSIYISVYLPDLVVGTVGGGTGLATQREALSVLGIEPGEKGSAQLLAEVIAGAVLAGELSLLASLAEGSLATAHQRLGREAKE